MRKFPPGIQAAHIFWSILYVWIYISYTDIFESARAIRTAFINTNQKRIEDMSKELIKLKELFAHALSVQALSLAVETQKLVVKSGWSILTCRCTNH